MTEKSFENLANEVVRSTKRGMELLTEIERLQKLAKQLPKIEAYGELVKEIVEKEKTATTLITNATLIQRELIKKQRSSIEILLNNL